jgi:hypothetical protein
MAADEREDYRGFVITWEEPPLTSTRWTANIASDSRQLLALLSGSDSVVIDGRDRVDMLATSKRYVDSLLKQPGAT